MDGLLGSKVLVSMLSSFSVGLGWIVVLGGTRLVEIGHGDEMVIVSTDAVLRC